jgi:pilus assembly protein Flp/PilA
MNLLHVWQYLVARFNLQRDDERGASLVEYALLVALIAVVCIVAIQVLGESASEKFSEVGGSIDAAG